jgi:DNA-binding NtrC family response regulator
VGFEVETCVNASEAVGMLMRRRVDMAMVDLRMPDVNGLHLLGHIKATVPSCEVVLMTGFAAVDSAVEASRLGAREYLTKPFDFARLRQVLVEIRDDLRRAGVEQPGVVKRDEADSRLRGTMAHGLP